MIEQLESRRMLSGNVQVKLQDGILFLRGDEQANHVTLETTGRYTRVSIDVPQEGIINHTLRKRKFLNFEGAINVALGGGDDRLRIHRLSSGTTLIVRMGDGNDQLAIDNSTFAQGMSIAGGAGGDTINLMHATIAGSSSVRGDDGDDALVLTDSIFEGPLSVRGGDGSDDINYAGSVFRGRAHLQGNRGNDRISGESVVIESDFRQGADGWRAEFAEAGDPTFMELQSGLRPLPPELNDSGTGFLLSSNNHSADTFMFLKRRVAAAAELNANQLYQAVFDIRFASNVPTGCGGIGGAPGEHVVMKAGVTQIEPITSPPANRLNVDKGNQSHDGPAGSVLGNIANGVPCSVDALKERTFVSLWRSHVHPVVARSDSNGQLWLMVGTDSGFEGRTTLYYQELRVRLVPLAASAQDDG